MNFYTSLDLVLRGGALSVCAIICVQMLRQKPRTTLATICSVFVLCAAGYIIAPILLQAFEPLSSQNFATALGVYAVQFLGFMTVVGFWMFARALATDQYRIGILEITVVATTALMYIPICVVVLPFAGVIKQYWKAQRQK